MATLVSDILTSVGYRLYPDGSTTISTTSEPTQTECIQWITETLEELLTVCAELGSEVGRTAAASIAISSSSSAYNDLASLLFAPVMYRTENGDQFSGWLEKTSERVPLRLTTEAELINYDPSLTQEPTHFYIDGSNNIVFIPTPNASYTAKIPYYGYITAMSATTDTIPFLRIFDNVIIESVTMRSQNREEYDLSYELKWYQYIRKQARRVLLMRKNPKTRISV